MQHFAPVKGLQPARHLAHDVAHLRKAGSGWSVIHCQGLAAHVPMATNRCSRGGLPSAGRSTWGLSMRRAIHSSSTKRSRKAWSSCRSMDGS